MVTGQANEPLAEAVVVHKVNPNGPVITIDELGVAVPEITGLVLTCALLGTAVRLGTPLAVKLVVAEVVPPGLLATAVRVAGPAVTLTTQE
jgi:hypothetical protein